MCVRTTIRKSMIFGNHIRRFMCIGHKRKSLRACRAEAEHLRKRREVTLREMSSLKEQIETLVLADEDDKAAYVLSKIRRHERQLNMVEGSLSKLDQLLFDIEVAETHKQTFAALSSVNEVHKSVLSSTKFDDLENILISVNEGEEMQNKLVELVGVKDSIVNKASMDKELKAIKNNALQKKAMREETERKAKEELEAQVALQESERKLEEALAKQLQEEAYVKALAGRLSGLRKIHKRAVVENEVPDQKNYTFSESEGKNLIRDLYLAERPEEQRVREALAEQEKLARIDRKARELVELELLCEGGKGPRCELAMTTAEMILERAGELKNQIQLQSVRVDPCAAVVASLPGASGNREKESEDFGGSVFCSIATSEVVRNRRRIKHTSWQTPLTGVSTEPQVNEFVCERKRLIHDLSIRLEEVSKLCDDVTRMCETHASPFSTAGSSSRGWTEVITEVRSIIKSQNTLLNRANCDLDNLISSSRGSTANPDALLLQMENVKDYVEASSLSFSFNIERARLELEKIALVEKSPPKAVEFSDQNLANPSTPRTLCSSNSRGSSNVPMQNIFFY